MALRKIRMGMVHAAACLLVALLCTACTHEHYDEQPILHWQLSLIGVFAAAPSDTGGQLERDTWPLMSIFGCQGAGGQILAEPDRDLWIRVEAPALDEVWTCGGDLPAESDWSLTGPVEPRITALTITTQAESLIVKYEADGSWWAAYEIEPNE